MINKHENSVGVYWDEIGIPESHQGDQMTEYMVEGETEDLVKKVIFSCFTFCMSWRPFFRAHW
jgi:hypothetical protein